MTRGPTSRGGCVAGLRVALVALALAVLTVALAPLQVLAIRRNWPLARRLPHLWHRLAAPISGIRVHRVGAPAAERPLLLVSNHQSWADIVVLGSAMPLCFIAKAEVRGWQVFGWLARLQRTVFVERERRGRTREQAEGIARRLAAGDAMVLFAEGTTSDGNGVLPFKTALFGAAAAALDVSGRGEMWVQPVSVAYTGANGLPLGRFGRPLAAWPGDVPLAPHLLSFLREGAVEAEVSFGEPLIFRPGDERKQLARRCETRVRQLLLASLASPRLMKTSLASPPRRADIGKRPLATEGTRPDRDGRRAFAKDA